MKGFIKDIIIVLVIVFAVTFFIKPVIVKDVSMQPTLYENNYLLVSKQAYRFGDAKRGDIIIFQSDLPLADDNGNDTGKGKLLIKRIIGLPEDVITITGEKVYVNGKLQKDNYTLDGETPGEIKDLKVPKGQFFVMGDNRRKSDDSRDKKVGCVEAERVKGKAFVRLYPFNKIGLL